MACTNAETVINEIVTGAVGPLSVSGDAGTVTMRPTRELIDAANYLAGICASRTKRLGVRYTHLTPDGTVHVRFRNPRLREPGEW